MNRRFTFILMLLAAMTAGRGVAAVSTNVVPATNAAPASAAPSNVAPAVATTEAPRSSGKIDFDSFKLVRDRNIFDMSRTGRIGPRSAPRVVHVDDFTLVGTMSYEKGLYAFFDGSSSEYRQTRKTDDKIADFKIAKIANDYVELANTNGKTIKMGMGATIRREDKGPWLPPVVRNDVALADSGSSNHDSSRSDRSRRSDRSSRSDSSGSDSNTTDSSGSSRSDRRLYRNFRGDRPAGSGSSSSMMGDPGPGQKSDSASSSNSGGSEADVIKRLMEKRAQQKGDQ